MRLLFIFLLLPLRLFANEMPVVIGGSLPNYNVPYATVTVCEEDTKRCKNIDKIMFDTGSSGLRIKRSALRGLHLQDIKTRQGEQIFGCAKMAGGSGYWGPLAVATIHLGDEVASHASFQIVEDSSRPNGIECNRPSPGNENGILGLGTALSIPHGFKLYVNGNPSPDDSYQPKNLLTYLEKDNNGFSVSFPSLPNGPEKRVEGKVVFGIGTQDNNQTPQTLSVCIPKPDQYLFVRHESSD